MVSQAVPLGQFEISSTPTQSELLQEQQQFAEDQREQKDWPELNKISDTRIRLLVEKYEGEATSEDSARLDILTERLRRLSPRVTPDDIDRFVTMVDNVERIADRVTKLREKYNLA
jgi:hypothetical protein